MPTLQVLVASADRVDRENIAQIAFAVWPKKVAVTKVTDCDSLYELIGRSDYSLLFLGIGHSGFQNEDIEKIKGILRETDVYAMFHSMYTTHEQIVAAYRAGATKIIYIDDMQIKVLDEIQKIVRDAVSRAEKAA